ncbi:hypothetical protein AVEN_141199-1 [Araneus ventricosus]|uniref:Uncharacterized protein n=1 Tax=Araneus ventricosus TaxID=182803 RepID=A0A4Y2EQK4_ARAVE|nr:hypothetical protein AVEN_141199-1 [Araneus ventricosus]
MWMELQGSRQICKGGLRRVLQHQRDKIGFADKAWVFYKSKSPTSEIRWLKKFTWNEHRIFESWTDGKDETSDSIHPSPLFQTTMLGCLTPTDLTCVRLVYTTDHWRNRISNPRPSGPAIDTLPPGGHGGLLQGRRVPVSKPDSTEDPSCMWPVAR